MGATILEKVRVRAPAEIVWAFVADPVMESAWNPKIIAVDRTAQGAVTPGERYRMIFAMSGRNTELDVEIVDVDEPRRVVCRCTQSGRPGWITLRYVLRESRGVTRVRQEIDMSRAGIPRLVRGLIWVISRTGRPDGKRYLETLREQAEAVAAG